MKKIIFAVMAVAAIGFTSCGNKTQQGEAIDSVAIVDSLAQSEADGVIDALKAAIDSKDAGLLKDILEQCKAKVAELVKQNPALAKEYVAKVQSFVKENEAAIKEAFAGNAAAAAAVNALTSEEAADGLSGAIDKLIGDAADVKDAAKDAAAAQVDAAKEATNKAVEDTKAAAKQQADDAKAAAKEKANNAIDNAAASAKKSLGL
ncbi:MAG: hypothetical protein IJ782_07170 [Prevotella sp.]|nr:hypothetical protein [Prevotella sp.]